VPKPLVFFNPPKGIDVVTELAELPKEYSPEIINLILDRGLLRSRFGVEKYHDSDGVLKIQRTVDLVGTASQAAPQLTARSTAAQGSGAGWTDPDGVNDGINSLTVDATTPFPVSLAANRLYNIVGDPTAGANVDAWDDKYVVKFTVTATRNTFTVFGVPADVTAIVQVEYSTDGGSIWTTLAATYSVTSSGSGVSSTYQPTVVVPGSPTQVRFRLLLKADHISGTPGGSGSVSVQPFSGTWPTNAYPVTWSTQASTVVPLRIPIRWTESHIQTYDDATEATGPWTNDYTFPATQINNDNLLPSYVTWKDTIVSNDIGNTTQVGAGSRIGSKGLVSTLLASPHTTTILTHSPRAAHLAVFGNRVIATRTNEWTATTDPWVEATVNLARIRWCVKNNDNDWDGIGSGFEDLFIPGGHTDEAMGTFPINDDTALIVSERSVRRVDLTGFVDAPFRFSLLTDQLGTRSRYSIQAVPSGVVFLGYDDVVLVTLGEIRRLATKAIRNSLKAITNDRLAQGYYDSYNSRYIVVFKEGSTQVLWFYSFLDSGWTKISLPFDVVFMDRAYFNNGGATYYGSYFTMAIAGGFSARDNPNRTKDIDVTGADIDSPIEIRTGFIIAGDPLRKTELIEAQVLYESAATQTLIFEYSTNGGASWTTYSIKSISSTTRPSVLSVRKRLETEGLQIRVRSQTLGSLKMYSLHAFAVPGAMIRS